MIFPIVFLLNDFCQLLYSSFSSLSFGLCVVRLLVYLYNNNLIVYVVFTTFLSNTPFNMIYQSFQSRIMLELNYMLCYGAARPSISLLQRLGLLEILLPFHVSQSYIAIMILSLHVADCRSSIL